MENPLQVNDSAITDTSIRPFRIAIAQSELDDLQARLRRTRWPDELPVASGEYGASLTV